MELEKEDIRQGEFARYILYWSESSISFFLSTPQKYFSNKTKSFIARFNAINQWLADENRVQSFQAYKEIATSKGFYYYKSHYLKRLKVHVVALGERSDRKESEGDSNTTSINFLQKQVLMRAFNNGSYKNLKTIEKLSEKLDLSFEVISKWFEDRENLS